MVVPFLTIRFGWQWGFLATGLVGFAWLALWWSMYEQPDRHPRVGAAELAYITAGVPEPSVHVAWKTLLPHRQTWAVAIAKFMTDPIWWVYLFWIPDFFGRKFGLSLLDLGPPVIVVYLVSDVGSVFGGWLSSRLIKQGWTVNASRKTAMLLCATAVIPIVAASRVEHMWTAVALISLAAAAHQGWSANVYTLASDMFPRQAVGSVIGFAGMSGAVGGMLIAKVTGYMLQNTGSYLPVFIIAGTTYLVTLLMVHVLAPRLAPVQLDR
jgi:ACS family hexuronate transporter-like MFS transporter